ncbi:diguanylate cyclase (GGDEF) domain-containing protein [Clostridium collagenovorans DSM 3089]|uniref:Diguanylate cyclase (GGDEF) domain-containing protein n=1 Tax=Clostridium collagenovorans DSM 3089 TaxID=1121306 RepID=A0A1M5Y5V6_9CLOT|nr:GGDEF domain-containing protein [Clostridium collagenovorans]SHI07194.1 diguanylate cyclase (GGDEF) domain-containing protein [Clostridium collagenovorans DSM 3089]
MSFVDILITLVRNIIPYYYLMKWKEPKKKSISIVGISVLTMILISNLALIYGFRNPILFLIIVTIPSLAIFYLFSEYKDGRFLLTFSMVDNITAVIFFLVDIFSYLINIDKIVKIFLQILMLILIGCISKLVSKRYHELMTIKSSGWIVISALSFLYYIMLYAFIAYPTYIVERIEYLPIAILYCVLVIVTYMVIFRIMVLTKEVYKRKEKEYILSAQLEKQEIQLELQDLYYKMAYTDGLTGLKNRTAYEEKLDEIRTKRENVLSLWYISFDLNYLKQTNDSLGHHIGDNLIKSLANAFKEAFKNNKNIFRVGGDEFVVILEEDISEEELIKELENFQRVLGRYSKIIDTNISVAYGYSLFKNSEDNFDKVIICADKQMYINKNNMKNN